MGKRPFLTWSRLARLMRATQFWSVPEEAGPLRSGTYPTITRPWLHWPAVRECSLGRARLLLVGLNGISRSAVVLWPLAMFAATRHFSRRFRGQADINAGRSQNRI